MAMPPQFKALIVPAFGEAPQLREDVAPSDLPVGDVVVRVQFSSLNYKDGLAVTSKGKVLRVFPGVPGIDLAGIVEESASSKYQPGDAVLVTGCGIGENVWGGYSEYARLPSEWLVPLPPAFSMERAMAIGTAGFTAMLSVMALQEHGVAPGGGTVLVTGASGGVGSLAIAILASLGYHVAASTGRPQEADYLRNLGAAEIVDRAELAAATRPLASARWAGAVDSVGGTTLAHVLAETSQWGSVASCGLAGGAELSTTVLPFILRGVNLLGINSVETVMPKRLEAWNRLARGLPPQAIESSMRVVPLGEVPRLADEILQGKIRGRTVIKVGE